jgi:CubicO group peptidase (beta-lactamase class C family)
LEIRVDSVVYRDLPATEWVVFFKNAGNADTPILTDVRELDYGCMWWSGDAGVHHVSFAWGHGGQLIVLVEDLRMIVVATARPQPGFDAAAWQQERAVLDLVFQFVAAV